jgi:hypothetical protein
LICGDARDRGAFKKLLGDSTAKLVFVDPPYNIKIQGHVSGKGRVKHREFVQASGEKTTAQFTKFLEDSLQLLAEHSVDGAIHFVCSDWRHMDEMLAAGRELNTDVCVPRGTGPALERAKVVPFLDTRRRHYPALLHKS